MKAHCHCHDPLVFGHQCGHPTFRAGETFTITGGRIMTASEAAQRINQLAQYLQHELYRVRTRAQ